MTDINKEAINAAGRGARKRRQVDADAPAGRLGADAATSPLASIPAPAPASGETVELVELLFFAYRDFTGDPDVILEEYGFGRAHHRVLHFVSRYPGLRVADLLDILKITKQSLARVLKQLIDEGFIEQLTGAIDRRERRLHVTPRGEALTQRLLAPQLRRVEAALRQVNGDAVTQSRNFLYNMIDLRERDNVDRLFARLAADEGAGQERAEHGQGPAVDSDSIGGPRPQGRSDDE